jgi:tRNA-Thr(GGU) m(6)t(6)A37 methyltransferase TsaA
MDSKQEICLTPIGYVKTAADNNQIKNRTHLSQIIVNPELAPALDGVADYSHLYVLFWIHELAAEKREILKVYPRGRTDLPLSGVFATRSPVRPNPIGLTVVELVAVEGNVLTVRGLDAYDGSPVLDLKPYDLMDEKENVRVPAWWLKLREEKEVKDRNEAATP